MLSINLGLGGVNSTNQAWVFGIDTEKFRVLRSAGCLLTVALDSLTIEGQVDGL